MTAALRGEPCAADRARRRRVARLWDTAAVTRAATPATGLALSAVLVLAAASGQFAAAVAVVLVVVAVTSGWPALLSLPSPRGTASVVGGTGTAGVVVVLLTPGDPRLRALPVVLAVAVLGAFVHQLLRRDGRPRVVDGLSGAVAGLVVTGMASGWLAALSGTHGLQLVAAAGAAVGVGSLSAALSLPVRLRGLVGLVLATAVGALVALPEPGVRTLAGGVLGLAAGVVVVLVHGVLLPLTSSRRHLAGAALGAAPVAACGVLVYALGRVLAP